MASGRRATTISERHHTDPQRRSKGAPMRHFRAIALPIAVVALAAIVAGAAFAATQKKIAFTGSYKGTVTEKVDGSNVTALANASGKGTLVGSSKLAGTVAATTANPPCSPLNG